MKRVLLIFALATVAAGVAVIHAQQKPQPFVPVSEEMLLKPSPNDWLMYSRTYDAQRFSPLNQITTKNVGQLKEVFKQELPAGVQESIPIVYRGVMYFLLPGNAVRAIDATTGALIWEHKRAGAGATRAKTISIYEDMIFNSTPDGFIEAIDAKTGELRWETKSSGRLTAGTMVIEGKVITGRACAPKREDCYIAAHDAKTGKEVWKFFTAAASNEPGGETWAGAPDETRAASTWALPGGYDPSRRLIYWGVANPTPNTRANRHGGNSNAIPTESPADLYSNSTIALDPDTGKLKWYYQHLPGDDWDEDYANERTLLRTKLDLNPKFAKWINPDIKRGEQRDVIVMIGEGGGLFVNDRVTGQFLWANPFPFDTPDFLISNIDGKTGKVFLNKNKLFTGPSDNRVICYWNTRSYWPTSYHPGVNALFVPYVENCLNMTSAGPNGQPREQRGGIPRPGSDPNTWAGLMKVNMTTGEMKPIHVGRAPSNGAVLTTAGNLVFFGDLDQKLRAFDAESGKMLWEQTIGGPIQNSTITYSVNGKQYIAVLAGSGALSGGLMDQAGIKPNRNYNALYVYALP